MAVPQALLLISESLENLLGDYVLDSHQSLSSSVEDDTLAEIFVHFLTIVKRLNLVAEIAVFKVEPIHNHVEFWQRVLWLNFCLSLFLQPTLLSELSGLPSLSRRSGLLSCWSGRNLLLSTREYEE